MRQNSQYLDWIPRPRPIEILTTRLEVRFLVAKMNTDASRWHGRLGRLRVSLETRWIVEKIRTGLDPRRRRW